MPLPLKRAIQMMPGLLYLAAIGLSLVVLYKTGASVFYKKAALDTRALTADGQAYEYLLPIDLRRYNPDTLLVREDSRLLSHVSLAEATAGQPGSYAWREYDRNVLSILISPGSPASPAANGLDYTILIRPRWVTSNLGGMALLILLLPAWMLLAAGLMDGRGRAAPRASPWATARAWLGRSIRPARRETHLPGRAGLARRAASSVILAAFLCVLSEWVFFITKPSFMSYMTAGSKLKILVIAAFGLALIGLAAVALMVLLERMVAAVIPAVWTGAYFIPAALLSACLGLLLVDNFTYTLFGYGVVDTRLAARVAYALGFAGLFVYLLRKFSVEEAAGQRSWTRLAGGLFAAALLVTAFSYRPVEGLLAQSDTASRKPNIILIGSDGVSADSLSLYGYQRETTPFIDALGKESLVAMNNFSNSGHSVGSVTAMLTGRSPLATRVLFSPDTLKGSDAYQHLPGILRQNGYYNLSLGVRYYVDANAINFANAFDEVNCETRANQGFFDLISGLGYDDATYFLKTVGGRVQDRLAHILFIKDMPDVFQAVKASLATDFTDATKLDCLRADLDAVAQNGQPLFAHIHLMGTHGITFTPDIQKFSTGIEQDKAWMSEFYDDAILSFDAQVRQVTQDLQARGLYENTILVIYSDHAQKWDNHHRVPLVIHFPGGQYAGKVQASTQNMDVAPTLLDYMGIAAPAWMMGDSLLKPVDPSRLLVSADVTDARVEASGDAAVPGMSSPPFYQFGELTVFQCQNMHIFDLEKHTLNSTTVEAYAGGCPAEQLDPPEVIRARLGEMLAGFGFQLPQNW